VPVHPIEIPVALPRRSTAAAALLMQAERPS
jgi:hypothetical protein